MRGTALVQWHSEVEGVGFREPQHKGSPLPFHAPLFTFSSTRSFLGAVSPMFLDQLEVPRFVDSLSLLIFFPRFSGAVQCAQCQGTGVNSEDHFNGRFKAGGLCWLCRYAQKALPAFNDILSTLLFSRTINYH